MDRQISSNLYERLLLSTDKDSVLSVARNEKLARNAKDIIKDPMVLEFLGLKPESAYFEKDLENALITHLQEFMLELGNGVSLVARQKRTYLDGDDFLDLVFLNLFDSSLEVSNYADSFYTIKLITLFLLLTILEEVKREF